MYASLSVLLSGLDRNSDWRIIHFSKSITAKCNALSFTGQFLLFMYTGQTEAIASTGRAHCQRQVAFFKLLLCYTCHIGIFQSVQNMFIIWIIETNYFIMGIWNCLRPRFRRKHITSCCSPHHICVDHWVVPLSVGNNTSARQRRNGRHIHHSGSKKNISLWARGPKWGLQYQKGALDWAQQWRAKV